MSLRMSSAIVSHISESRMLNGPRRSQTTAGTRGFTQPPAYHSSHLPSVDLFLQSCISNGPRRSYQICTTEWTIPEIIASSMFAIPFIYKQNHCSGYKIKSCTFSFKEIHPKMSSSKRQPCSLGTQCVCIRSIHRYATGVFVQNYAQANAKTTQLRITVPLWGESIGCQWIPLSKVN